MLKLEYGKKNNRKVQTNLLFFQKNFNHCAKQEWKRKQI